MLRIFVIGLLVLNTPSLAIQLIFDNQTPDSLFIRSQSAHLSCLSPLHLTLASQARYALTCDDLGSNGAIIFNSAALYPKQINFVWRNGYGINQIYTGWFGCRDRGYQCYMHYQQKKGLATFTIKKI